MAGICYLIGAGPGDPGLLTLRGKECLASADLIVYDYLCNPALLRWTRPDAQRVFAGKSSGQAALTQEETNALLVRETQAGRTVARLKGGDPFVFGRGGEEAQVLSAAGVRFEIVPGVSSAVAVPAYAGIPITHRDHCSAAVFVTGHIDPVKGEPSMDYEHLARFGGTIVVLMGIGRLRQTASRLIEAGKAGSTPAAAIRWGTWPDQQTIVGRLDSLPDQLERANFEAPGIVVIGTVVTLRQELEWFERRPLFGKRVVVTRMGSASRTFASLLEEQGARVLEVPLIEVTLAAEETALRTAIERLPQTTWLAFTSAHGVEFFFQALARAGRDARAFGNARLAVVGPGTEQALRERGFAPDLVSLEPSAAGLALALNSLDPPLRGRLLHPTSDRASGELRVLQSAEVEVDIVTAYHTVHVPRERLPESVCSELASRGADWVTFASASAVEAWVAAGISVAGPWRTASIGPSTSAALRQNGLPVDLESETASFEALTSALAVRSSIRT